jgi:hypothetical protein
MGTRPAFSRSTNPSLFMTNTFSNFIVAPLLGWLTLLALLVVGYLGRLEYLERRRNRRLDEKREQISKGAPLRSKNPRPLAMRQNVDVLPTAPDCPALGRAFHKFDRHGGLKLRPLDLN